VTPLPPTTAHTALTLQSVGKNEAMLKALSTLNEFITASARTFQTFFSETQLVRALPCGCSFPHNDLTSTRMCAVRSAAFRTTPAYARALERCPSGTQGAPKTSDH
jgi:hypothetical protein